MMKTPTNTPPVRLTSYVQPPPLGAVQLNGNIRINSTQEKSPDGSIVYIDETARMSQNRAWALECLIKLGHTELWNTLNWQLIFCAGFTARRADARYDHWSRTAHVRFSADLWLTGEDSNRRQTVYHEVCHIVDAYLSWQAYEAEVALHGHGKRRRCGHGKGWKALMVKCGMPPERCSKVGRPLELVRFVKRFELRCPCVRRRPLIWTATRLTRFQNVHGPVHCAKCLNKFKVVEAPKPSFSEQQIAAQYAKPVD